VCVGDLIPQPFGSNFLYNIEEIKMQYSKFSAINVSITDIKWCQNRNELPIIESYRIGFDTLREKGIIAENEDDPMVYDFSEKGLDFLVTKMLEEDYGCGVEKLIYSFSPLPIIR
jgi:hypothetical protein